MKEVNGVELLATPRHAYCTVSPGGSYKWNQWRSVSFLQTSIFGTGNSI